MTSSVCIVTMAEGKPYRFHGDVDFYVDSNGGLSVYNYDLRAEADSTAIVFAAVSGAWLTCLLEPSSIQSVVIGKGGIGSGAGFPSNVDNSIRQNVPDLTVGRAEGWAI